MDALGQTMYAGGSSTFVESSGVSVNGAPATKATQYAEFCRTLVMPPLEDLSYSVLKVPPSPRTQDLESAYEKREAWAEYRAEFRKLKLIALGLVAGTPRQYGADLYWNLELAYKREVCGAASLTSAELAMEQTLSNKARAMLHERAKKKRKKKLTKFVAVAGIMVGAAFLGPAITGAVKGAGAATATGTKAASAAAIKAKAVAAAAKVGTAVKVATTAKAVTAVKVATAAKTAADVAGSTFLSQAQDLVPKVIETTNAVRTVKAIADGEVPPPPISLDGNNFKEWGVSIATQLAEKELGEKVTAIQEAEIAAEMAQLQRDALERLPSGPIPSSPNINVSVPVQREMLASQEQNKTMQTVLMLGIPIALALVFRS